MYTSANKRLIIYYLSASVLAFVFDKIYALFAHGVASPYMSLLFLFPLLGGVIVFGLLALLIPEAAKRRGWRPGTNLYNSGLATLTVASLLEGIFEIAGTASGYTIYFWGGGVLLMLAGSVVFTFSPKYSFCK